MPIFLEPLIATVQNQTMTARFAQSINAQKNTILAKIMATAMSIKVTLGVIVKELVLLASTAQLTSVLIIIVKMVDIVRYEMALLGAIVRNRFLKVTFVMNGIATSIILVKMKEFVLLVYQKIKILATVRNLVMVVNIVL